jgi:hypothetical protein
MKLICNPDREESAGKPTNGEAQLPIGKTMTHQRQWVGLTDEDLVDCESEEDVRFVRAIEAKLKEKNT